MALSMKLSKSLKEILVKQQKDLEEWKSFVFSDWKTQQERMIFVDAWLYHLEDKVNETFDHHKNKSSKIDIRRQSKIA